MMAVFPTRIPGVGASVRQAGIGTPIGGFVSSWKTDNTGPSGDAEIALPLESSGSYNFTVDWGDGDEDTITTWDQLETTHTYSVAGTYTVIITGEINGWRFNNAGDRQKLVSISSWGSLQLGNSNGYFYGCVNLNVTAVDSINLVGTTTLENAFRDCAALTNIGYWSVGSVTNMSNTFDGCSVFNQDIGNWDVSSVTIMFGMFDSCTLFNQDLNDWDVSLVTDMAQMFLLCGAFNGDITAWDVSLVDDFSSMFQSTQAFNQDISGWVTSASILMNNMFNNATAFNQDISGWDVSLNAGFGSMFNGAIAFDQDIGGWDVTAATNMTFMFNGVALSQANYDALLVGWEAQAVNNGVTFDGGNSTYSAGAPATARADLETDHSWTITDGGEA